MKRTRLVTAAALVAVLAITAMSVTGCAGSSKSDNAPQSADEPVQQDQKVVKYTCSMHPEVVQDKPGDCPKCGMKLVEKR